MLALAFVGKTCSLLFFFLAWRLYKPPTGLQASSQEKLENGNAEHEKVAVTVAAAAAKAGLEASDTPCPQIAATTAAAAAEVVVA